jgi:hypothetical protein
MKINIIKFIILIISSSILLSGCTKREEIQKTSISPQQLLLKLNDLSYTRIADTNFAQQLSLFPIKTKLNISEEQSEKLKQSLKCMFLAFNVGNKEAYMSFRTPTGPQWKMNSDVFNNTISKWKKETNYSGKENIPSETEAFELLINKVSKGTCYKQFWQGVCFEDLDSKALDFFGTPSCTTNYGVTIYDSSRFEKLPANLSEKETNIYPKWEWSFILGYGEEIIFREKPNAREILSKEGKLTYADCFFFVLRQSDYLPRPIYARFYWNSTCQVWVPFDIAFGNKSSYDSEKEKYIYELF